MNRTYRLIGAIAFVAAVCLVSCGEKEYVCNCTIDGPDTAGISLDYDTTLTINSGKEELADTECEAYEGASSILIPGGVVADQFTVNCSLTLSGDN
ncbi:MAG: hypothetical protein HQ500_03250 [Flavobacteriales bacterium]|nr:hypothetical protein [Flavobacteriales bacterium]